MFHLKNLVILFGYIINSCEIENASIGWQSLITFSNPGLEFSPFDVESLLLMKTIAYSTISCFQMCHLNTKCRIFDYDHQSFRCRLFQGNIQTMGFMVRSPSLQSVVGTVEIRKEYFLAHSQSCSSCNGNRYLVCLNGICECPSNTFYGGSICQSQKLLGSECVNETECRSDLNHTCLPRQQCGPLSLQIGITVAGYENGTGGSSLDALQDPNGIAHDSFGALYVVDAGNERVIKIEEGSSIRSIVAGTGIAGIGPSQFNGPSGIFLDQSSNIYVTDLQNHRIMLWKKGATSGIIVAGNGTKGSTLNTLRFPREACVDSKGNIYVSDTNNDRIVKWPVNATSGTLVAGTGAPGNNSGELNEPYGIALDEEKGFIYVVERANHRVQRCYVNGTKYCTTVAGGNGQGSNSNQLNLPRRICISKKTGAIYIADTKNNRIQRWDSGASIGVTIAGTAGVTGTDSTLFDSPINIYLSLNETFLYVSDNNNHRVQRFRLI